MAGQETTSTTITMGMIFLLLNPEVQKKLHEELDTVVGSDRFITLEDKPNLHYTNAVIQEILRIGISIGMAPFRRTTKDVQIKGYFIPKHTTIGPQASIVLHDEKLFPDPNRFMPERFLDSNGNFKNSDQVITFGIGKRVCPGESLARMEVYLFIANLLNMFKYSVIPEKPPTLERQMGAGNPPFPFVCKIEDRFGKSK
uniref:Cytochrome P450 n=1 Tax=Acrobeloides nanus TaxID=290746 RepID=A0A914DPL4_9BILA